MMLAAVTRLEVAPKVRGKYNGSPDRSSSVAAPRLTSPAVRPRRPITKVTVRRATTTIALLQRFALVYWYVHLVRFS
jgi:hypothetical protein